MTSGTSLSAPLRVDPDTLTANALAGLASARDEPDWLRAARLTNLERYLATPWPTGTEEEWRRTSLKDLPRDAALDENAATEVSALDPDSTAAGVVFASLADAAVTHSELVRPYLTDDVAGPATHAAFWQLARATWTTGTFLSVPARTRVDLVLRARTVQAAADGAMFPVTLVVVGEDAEVTLLEEFSSPDGSPSWFGGIVDLRTARGAKVRYASLQLLGDQAWRVSAQRVMVGQDAEVTTLNAEIGSRVTKLGLDIQMTGAGGTSRLLGLLAAGDDQKIDINSVQDLIGSHTTSDLLYLSALYDRAHAAFYGMTRVRSEAKQTSSYQECRNLLLSPGAGAEPIPVLEIETNDILRCGHGATAGAIDPTQMFYAQTRGLSADAAERMIVRGFFERAVADIGSEPIRARVLAALASRIGQDAA
ncbi:MAG TPA: SufD family Fe-S cluster assembly protein [Candidatus Limnocylindria bacterium]